MIPGECHLHIEDMGGAIIADITIPTHLFEVISHDATLAQQQSTFHNCTITATIATMTGLETKTYYAQKHRLIPELKIRHLLTENIGRV